MISPKGENNWLLEDNNTLKSCDLVSKLVTMKENGNDFNDILYHKLLISDKNV